MNRLHLIAALLLSVALPSNFAFAQSSTEEIKSTREASNKALRNYDDELSFTYLTDDVLITTGNGTLITGKGHLRKYVQSATGEPMFWIQTLTDIQVNEERLLAWETGTWEGFNQSDENKPVIGGNYSAMWTKESGTWLIKSQLFVTLK
tara:strand:+ start:38978 stop:39424 length:447 start_codon:yes stop_codon:yes gene_type:complete